MPRPRRQQEPAPLLTPRPQTRSEEPEASAVSICIFMESGHTFTFHGCTIRVDNESVLVFSYIAMSDGKPKTATFSKFNIVGFSIH